MATDGPTFNQWLREAKIDRQKLSPDLIAVLEASFRFVQRCGGDYYSRRVLSHFLLLANRACRSRRLPEFSASAARRRRSSRTSLPKR